MPDLGFDWLDLLLLGPMVLPWLAVPGALLLGSVWYRRTRSMNQAFAAAGVGLFGAPSAAFLLGFLADKSSRLGDGNASPLLTGLLLVAAALAILVAVLMGVRRASLRKRG